MSRNPSKLANTISAIFIAGAIIFLSSSFIVYNDKNSNRTSLSNQSVRQGPRVQYIEFKPMHITIPVKSNSGILNN